MRRSSIESRAVWANGSDVPRHRNSGVRDAANYKTNSCVVFRFGRPCTDQRNEARNAHDLDQLRTDSTAAADAVFWLMDRGHTMLEQVLDRKDELERICRDYHVQRLELFGSALSDRYRQEESDLDFLVEFKPLPSGTYADTFFGLIEALEGLFGRPVDLVVASAIKNPYFKKAVESNKMLLYAA